MDIEIPILFLVLVVSLIASFFLTTVFLSEKKRYWTQILILIILSALFFFGNIVYKGDGVAFSKNGELLVTTIQNDKNYIEKVKPVGKIKLELNKDKKSSQVIIRKNLIRGTKIYAPEKDIQELNGLLKSWKVQK